MNKVEAFVIGGAVTVIGWYTKGESCDGACDEVFHMMSHLNEQEVWALAGT